MEWKELSKFDAKHYFETELFQDDNIVLYNDSDYFDLRNKLNQYFKETLIELGLAEESISTNKYEFDCIFGLKLYKLLTSDEYYMGEREASNDDIWRYIQLYIVPNIVVARWGPETDVRMFKQSNRLYLKCLWWYIHLSNCGDKTKEIILNGYYTTDAIVQLTERTGGIGYQIDLYRSIVYNSSISHLNRDEFRKLMKLNSAKLKVINPYLVEGGITSYVNELIRKVKGE